MHEFCADVGTHVGNLLKEFTETEDHKTTAVTIIGLATVCLARQTDALADINDTLKAIRSQLEALSRVNLGD